MMVQLTPEDAAQVRAILLTHSEMQDNRAIPSMEIIARLKRDEPGELVMIDSLNEQVMIFEDDSTNLRRLADMFTSEN